MRGGPALIAVAFILAACTSGGSAQPARPTPSAGPVPAAEHTDILNESIELVYASNPQPDWFPAYRDLRIEDGWAYIATTLTPDQTGPAETMCHDIAAITFGIDNPVTRRIVMP